MDIIKQALKIMEDSAQMKGDKLGSSQASKDYCRLQLAHEPEEVFACLFLDTHHRVIAFERITRGTIGEATIHLRPIVRMIIQHNAAKVILTHNHPSGITKPSEADIEITHKFSKFLKEIDCIVVDHIIVSKTETTSLAELRLIP